MSSELTKLGGALKEFSGDSRSAADISNIVARALTGEVEGLKTLGLVIDQTDTRFQDLVKQKIRDEGLTRQQAKAEAIFQTAIEGSADALEQFENNTESLSRQQAILNAQQAEIADTLAHLLTPAFIAVTKEMNEQLKATKNIIGANENWFLTLIALLEPSGNYAKVLELQGIALREIKASTDEANAEAKENIEIVKTQIRNVFFLKDAIDVLRKEQSAQGTSTRRISEINRELIPIQKETRRF